jgi:hypothetical protein
MEWVHVAACFLGGAFLTNAVPYFVSGVIGPSFQNRFATPRDQGSGAD